VQSTSWAERNAIVPKDRRIDFHIGIDLGEVITEGSGRHGEGINIAARPQQLADAGGICISGEAANDLKKKLALSFEPMGLATAKKH
jgi:adenylate cyclase